MDEQWRPLAECDLYDVSDQGRARSWKNGRKGRAEEPRLLTPHVNPRVGYPVVAIWVGGKQCVRMLARLVMETFVGPKPEGMQITYRDENRLNCALSNLVYCSRSDILRKSYANGRKKAFPKNNRFPNAKLSEADILHIRSSPENNRQLAARFHVQRMTISHIRQGKSWKDGPWPDEAALRARDELIAEGRRERAERRRAKLAEKHRRFKAAHPGYWTQWDRANRDRRREQRRALYAKDPEKHRDKTRRWLEKNREAHLAKRRAKRRANPEHYRQQDRRHRAKNPETIKLAQRAWYRKNAERAKAYSRAYRLEHADEVRRQQAEYRRKNPHLSRMREARRRAMKKGCSAEDRAEIRAFYRYVSETPRLRCYWCKKVTPRNRRHVDHMIPLSRGGRHHIDNLCVACAGCNTVKKDQPLEQWQEATGHLPLSPPA